MVYLSKFLFWLSENVNETQQNVSIFEILIAQIKFACKMSMAIGKILSQSKDSFLRALRKVAL